VRSGDASLILRTLGRRLASADVALGLRRDTALPFRVPGPPLSLTVRPLEPEDVPQLVDVTGPDVTRWSIEDRLHLAYLIEAGLQTCYVAVTREGHICYVQFLIDPGQNEKIRALYGDLMPRLEPDEALLEAAFSLERYRGRGVMIHVMPELARKARALGLRWLVLFASVTNVPMLKACQFTGFVPYVERREAWRFFRRQVTFRPLPAGAPYPLHTAAAGAARDLRR
jgi:GNAT superfamily N-acetyltransferase